MKVSDPFLKLATTTKITSLSSSFLQTEASVARNNIPPDISSGTIADEAEPVPGPTNGVDLRRIEKAVREILAAVGEDPDREGLLETPARVARMYAEMFSGLRQDPREHLKKVFTQQYDEVVLVRDITFCSMCEHHLLPFIGKAHIAYAPKGKVLGLSKLARLVEAIARRPQVQERMTEDIANLLVEELDAKGVAVVVEASHSCMTIRGVRKPGSLCLTSAMKGIFRKNDSSRAEVMQLIFSERR
jgi:GTP cyclohydrolase I